MGNIQTPEIINNAEVRPQLMGTDGFRDIATDEPGPGRMNPETVAGLTYVLVEMQTEAGAGKFSVIGRDTRPSGPELEKAAIAGAAMAGATVVRLGVAPTPTILRTAQTLRAGSAVALTASHNEARDNGWKGTFGADKPMNGQIEEHNRRYWSRVESGLQIPLDIIEPKVDYGLLVDYKSDVIGSIEREFDGQPLRGKIVVVDGANGAAMGVTPDILRRLGATVEEFACDGSTPINEGCGAADLSGVKQFLKERPELVQDPNFIGAVANDGDGDRLMGVGARVLPSGEMSFEEMDGNRVMELLAQGEPGIVGTEYTNDGTVDRLTRQGIDFEFCANGDVNVTNALRAKGWKRGGEFSGHLVDLDWLPSGDGVRMAAWLAAYAAKHQTNFAELADKMPLWPEKMAKFKLGRNNTAELERTDVIAEIAAAKADLGDDGRFVIRASGTEKGIYRVWGVGRDKEQVDRLVKRIGDCLVFPTTFAHEPSQIAIEDLDADGQDALRQMQEAGYDVMTGLRPEDLPAVAEIAGQDGVFKYCRRDLLERFGSVAMAEKWQKKGRLFFQAVGQAGLAGYGWTGPERSPELLDYPITFAVRVNERDAGKGLGTLLTRVIVSATKMRTKDKIGLETWASNIPAGKAYHRANAVAVAEKPGRRPAGRDEVPDPDGQVDDIRKFMVFA